MTTSQEATRFVVQHGPLDDLLGTLATRVSCTAQALERPRCNKARLIQSLQEDTAILVEIDRHYRLERRNRT